MTNKNYKFGHLFLSFAAFCIIIVSCGSDENTVSNPASLKQYIEVKPFKGFINDAVITVSGSNLSQEIGREIYSGYLNPGVEFKAGDVITSTGGIIRDTGIQMDDSIPMKYMYDGNQTTFHITPLTTLVAESMILSEKEPTLSNINNIKRTLVDFIDPDNLLEKDISKIDGDPESIPAIEGLGHTIYFSIKGTIDTLKALGYTIEENHVSKLWGSLASKYENSQESELDELLIEIAMDPNFAPNQSLNNEDLFSAVISAIYQKATTMQGEIIIAQQSGNKSDIKTTSTNLVYTVKILAQLSQTISDKINGKSLQTISFFVDGIADLISANIDLVRQKAVEDPDNQKDEIAAINTLDQLFVDKINTCDPESIIPDTEFCFNISENDINTIIFDLPVIPDPVGIIDWNPKDGVVIQTTEPDFDLSFSEPVNKDGIDKYFVITIKNMISGKTVIMLYINDEKWIGIIIPSSSTRVLKKITDDEYINTEWDEIDTKFTLHVQNYTFEGETYSLADGSSYSFSFELLEGATFKSGEQIAPVKIGPVGFSVHLN